jgi:hypothetical protein
MSHDCRIRPFTPGGTDGEESHAPARRAYEKAGFGPAAPSVYLFKAL